MTTRWVASTDSDDLNEFRDDAKIASSTRSHVLGSNFGVSSTSTHAMLAMLQDLCLDVQADSQALHHLEERVITFDA